MRKEMLTVYAVDRVSTVNGIHIVIRMHIVRNKKSSLFLTFRVSARNHRKRLLLVFYYMK